MGNVQFVLGTMNFGPQVNTEDAKQMLINFADKGFTEVDSAYVYNNGSTENILGEILPDFKDDQFEIATKVHPRITGKLDGEAIYFQFNESLKRMGLKKVDILYFHFPDKITPIDEALQIATELKAQGKIKELGISNYPAWMVADICHISEKNGWIKPTVYQGMYNGICRNIESELFPALRKFGLRFYAFNPLAGGMLTGKHKSIESDPTPGRFARLQSYRNRYWKKGYFDAIKVLNDTCKKENVLPVEAAFRWLFNHSLLDGKFGDKVIVGASSLNQLEQNISFINKGELPVEIIEALNDAWMIAKPDSPSYFQFFPK